MNTFESVAWGRGISLPATPATNGVIFFFLSPPRSATVNWQFLNTGPQEYASLVYVMFFLTSLLDGDGRNPLLEGCSLSLHICI